jgi:hypothetical protein
MVRAVGPYLPLAFLLWIWICLVQEPGFFRDQGIDLTWNAAATALIVLVFCSISISMEVPRPRLEIWACIAGLWIGVAALIVTGALMVLTSEWLYNGRADWNWLAKVTTQVALLLAPLAPASVLLARAGIAPVSRYLALGVLLAVSMAAQAFSVEPADAKSANFPSSALLTLGVVLLGPALQSNPTAFWRPNAHRRSR